MVNLEKEKRKGKSSMSITIARERMSDDGYKLLSDIYINSHTKMSVLCPEGHTYESTWNNFQSGKRCIICSRIEQSEKRRVPKDTIVNHIKQNGYKIIGGFNEYKTYDSKLVIECPNGHTYETKYKCFFMGTRCQECQGRVVRLTFDHVEQHVLLHHYKLVEFLDYQRKMTVICPSGHEYSVAWGNFQQGQRCIICVGKENKNYEQVKSIFEENGCELLTKTYSNTLQKLKFICACGKKSEKTFKDFQKSEKCKNCGMKEKGRVEFNLVKAIFEEAGCELLIQEHEYTKASAKMKYKCSCGNISFKSMTSIKRFARCTECKRISFIEKKAKEFGMIKSSYQQDYLNEVFNGSLNHPFKFGFIDIAFPAEKIAIEYDGSGHWLSVKMGKKTIEQFNLSEIQREIFLRNNGWRIVRIVSRKDFIPSEKMLLNMLGQAKQHFESQRTWITFDIDEGIIKTSKYTNLFDYGDLNKINKLEEEKNKKDKGRD